MHMYANYFIIKEKEVVTMNQEIIVQRINDYITSEGYRKEFIATKLNKATTVYSYLQGKHNIYPFAIDLATALGLESTFFVKEDYNYKPVNEIKMELNEEKIAHSFSHISKNGKDGLQQIGKLCDLVRIYS